MSVSGRIHSIQSMGTLDGPGVRFVVFLQGCNLRCGCCHNPDTWEMQGGTECTAEEIVKKAIRFKEYFGSDGGITLSGGEPLLQAEFAREVFFLCHKEGINTCLDTSGSILSDKVKALLEETDRVLLDIKYTDEEKYRKYVGCGMDKPLEFLSYLCEKKIPVTLRQVIIPELNGDEENVRKLREIAEKYGCIDKTELLPFKKICQVKYDKMGIVFPFADYETPDRELMQRLNDLIKD
ncbi:MAG: pyruvate formate lyase-activating protein [Clostridia bacterium]|nr:pyruvate formate lyase-activating protein [Clostridia bacterium]